MNRPGSSDISYEGNPTGIQNLVQFCCLSCALSFLFPAGSDGSPDLSVDGEPQQLMKSEILPLPSIYN